MEDSGIYAPPRTELLPKEPGDDGPLPWEDTVAYPSLKRRLWRTMLCFFKRPVWFFHRVGKGSETLSKPFSFYLMAISPIIFLNSISAFVLALISLEEFNKPRNPGWAPGGLDQFIGFLVLATFPVWYYGLCLAWALVIHGGLKLVGGRRVTNLTSTLRSAAYLSPLALPFGLLNLAVHPKSLYLFGTAGALGLVLIPGLSFLHAIPRWKGALGVLLALIFVVPLTWYAHHDFLFHLSWAIVEFKGWAK